MFKTQPRDYIQFDFNHVLSRVIPFALPVLASRANEFRLTGVNTGCGFPEPAPAAARFDPSIQLDPGEFSQAV